MNSLSLETILNSSFIDALNTYYKDLSAYLINSVVVLGNPAQSVLTSIESLPQCFECDDFQWKLLKVFTAVLFINLILIFVSWKIFGKQISERFMKPATSTAIEELKASVAKLKLPKEHTPRI